MIAIVLLAAGMMVGRPILMHMDGAGYMVIVGQAMRRDGALTNRHDGGRRYQTKRIQSDEQARHAPTPFSG